MADTMNRFAAIPATFSTRNNLNLTTVTNPTSPSRPSSPTGKKNQIVLSSLGIPSLFMYCGMSMSSGSEDEDLPRHSPRRKEGWTGTTTTKGTSSGAWWSRWYREAGQQMRQSIQYIKHMDTRLVLHK